MTAPWAAARYPGDAVRVQYLQKGEEIGDIRIQRYNEVSFRVATFLPGNAVCLPGDTIKVEPERSEWAPTKVRADALFDKFVVDASADGWQKLELG